MIFYYRLKSAAMMNMVQC